MIDPALRGFVEATDAAEAEARLSRLIEEEAAPLARRIAAHKLRAHARGAGDASREDVEDIAADVLLAVVSRLQALRADPRLDPIESLADYTAVTTYNAFAHYLRRRHPGRSRLKNRIRYVLTHDRRFALWTTPDGLACGLARWRPAAASADAGRSLDRLLAEPERWLRWTAPRGARRDEATLVGAILQAIGGPVDFDRLVGSVAALVPEPSDKREGSRDLESLADRTVVPADVALDRRQLTERMWNEVRALPLRQRFALLLNLRDGTGAGMLWVLPITGVASIREIAAALELGDLEMAELWNRLPLDDLAIAERLSCTRQQVINLRSAARKRLATRLREARDPATAPGPGNIRPVSASLKDEA